MKKKFVLTLALVLMVAVTLSAATPIEVSGVFDFGYKMTIKDDLKVTLADSSKYSTLVSVSSDYWEVNLAAGTKLFGDGVKPFAATADIFLDKALADEGVDMGDLGLTLHVGTGVGASAQSVFADKADWKNFKAEAGSANLGATVKYGDLVEVYLASDVAANGFVGVVGAKTAPVDGVTAALGYAFDTKVFAGSVAVDIAKLADLDFGLAATVAYFGDFDANNIWASLAGSYEGIGLWVQYGTNLTNHKFAAKASYATTVEGVDLGAGVKVSSVDLAADPLKLVFDFDASAAYTMGGVKYKLALGYQLKGDFVITPSVSFSW